MCVRVPFIAVVVVVVVVCLFLEGKACPMSEPLLAWFDCTCDVVRFSFAVDSRGRMHAVDEDMWPQIWVCPK